MALAPYITKCHWNTAKRYKQELISVQNVIYFLWTSKYLLYDLQTLQKSTLHALSNVKFDFY